MRKNFTLIELIVVVGIICVLASISAGALSRARASARRIECAGNLKQIGAALHLYTGTNSGYYPVACSLPSFNAGLGEKVIRLCDILSDYLPGQIFRCPSDNDEPTWFSREGSSYEFNGKLSGVKIDSHYEVLQNGASNVVAVFDYDCFHAVLPQPGTKNYLFVDGHVTDIE